MSKLFIILTGAALVAKSFSQNCSPYPARPQQCSAGNRYCPVDCTKTSRLSTICSSFVPTPAPVTVTAFVTITPSASVTTATKTVTQNATCATKIPYLNIFSFKNQNCSTSVTTPRPVCRGGLLGIGEECTCPSTKYTVTPNVIKINTPGIATLDDGYRYTQSTCVPLAVPDSNSVFFTVDGTDGTNATTSDCRVTFFTGTDCTGTQDGFNINKSGTCLSNDPTKYPPYNSAQFECSSVLGLI
ncbi:hypothetical protein KC340_g361 [Hortaea werneckii]|nr:hypothetical protein KC339_g13392 [Hortaea werneckii]KAI7245607.1 hypothetical protein KC365_g345 [Hortaea werneckii]KAI7340256.1 hypothetical protein KC340_g361 [Hortaea werneckii]KAI7377913.1 hypothetical protein KC328_g14174 [Hortaea werneckii]